MIQSELTAADYTMLARQAQALTAEEPNLIANLANISALLNENLTQINWVGFYLANAEQHLILGPFQGKPACVHIPFGQGVCGAAAESRQTQRVEDVHAFPGHIACDTASNSEIVIPIEVDNEIVAVLDIDSPLTGRFSAIDQEGLELLLPVLVNLDWTGYGRRV